ncbi:unnamed protein product [Effrenium voratum]|nr:unnamed protein product [Effrenium voratum]
MRLRPDVVSYSGTISAAEKCRQWRQALRQLEAMQDAGCQPNTISYNSALRALQSASEWRQALALQGQMMHRRICGDLTTCITALQACEQGSQGLAAEFLNELTVRSLAVMRA